MWRTRLTRTWDWLRSRKLVGEDEHHMFYTEFIAKGKPEKRYVEYKDQNITHSSDRMHIEWWSWLHNRRDNTPTIDEIAAAEARQYSLAQKVAILEAEDEKQRLRQFAGGLSPAPPSAAAAQEEARARRRKKAMMRLNNAATAESVAADSSVVPSQAGVAAFSDTRNRLNPEQDPKGSGEDFQPGSWQPAQRRRRET